MNRTEIEFPAKHAALRDDVHMLGTLVGEVLRDQGGDELFQVVEADRTLAIARRSGDASAAAELEGRVAGRAPALARDLERAFSTWFQAVNLAEQVHRIRRRRAYFQDDAERPQPGGVGDAIGRLRAAGLALDDVIGLLRTLHIVPVFMSHPTESTRRTILRKQLRLAELLYDRLNPTLAPSEQRASIGRIRSELTTLWQTEDHPRQRLTVADEREHVLFFLAEVLYRVLPNFYEEIAEALARHYGVDADLLELPTIIRFGSWVGGDMDGNPDVHAKSLRETLARQQQTIVNAYFLEVQSLAQLLSQSGSRSGVSAALQKRSDEYATRLPGARSAAPARHDRMPYRVFLGQIAERLRATYEGRPAGYESPAQFQRDIEIVAESLRQHRGRHAGLFPVRRLQRRIATFGFHLATLDVRQHADVHHAVLARALDEPRWTSLDPSTRHARLSELIARDLGPRVELDAVGKRTLAVFEAMLQCRRRYGAEAVGSYVVNGTEAADDVLAALLLARWAEAFDKRSNEIAIDIAPMFTSPEALARSGDILRELLADPLYRTHLDARGRRQSALVGYSESNKREGIVASRFAVYRAQGAIAAATAAAGEEHLLVHARGGSIPRGGGRIDAIVTAAPPSINNGWLKLTEQGEGINQHYGLGPIALRTLERAFGALTLASAAGRSGTAREPEPAWLAMAERFAAASARHYRGLVDDSVPFRAWFEAVTPIDVIERMQIGGRPLSRDGQGGFAGLRAVPWVFAWTQNRMLLPGWFGAGSGLRVAIDEAGLATVRMACREWTFLRNLIEDLEIMLARTDLEIAAHYDALWSGAGLDDPAGSEGARRFLPGVREEYALTRELVLLVKEQQQLLDADRTQQRALALRNPYVDPMNLMQVDLLRRWRTGGRTDRELLDALLASVNGIAQGLQDTG
ncbi:MAG: phosphoenolpyruvate carboxylase [Gammaproteobacteria bacterium]|nr:phosphoenolpyruvate carboxylase [Gammaproteobacteria bacterium]